MTTPDPVATVARFAVPVDVLRRGAALGLPLVIEAELPDPDRPDPEAWSGILVSLADGRVLALRFALVPEDRAS
jgi:hypothetical protein